MSVLVLDEWVNLSQHLFTMATIQTIVNEASDIITMETVHNKYMTEYIWVMNTLSYWIGQSLTGTKNYETNNP